ncbi:putative reverse transcriptase domain-containing protein [Tanacetum coccineum]
MDQKLRTYAERQSDNKRKADDSSRNNHGHQQQPFKRQNVAKVYNMGTCERKPYGGSLPKCTKCHLHHNGPCTQKCHKCNKVGHFARDCKSTGNTNVANTQKGNGAAPKGNGCFECGAPGNFKRDCPKLKNKDGGNGNAQGWVYAVGNAEKRGNASGTPDANVVTGLPPARPVEFQIDLIPGAAPVARAPYGYVKYCKKSVKKRTRERMSDQEAKEIKAEAREIMPQPSTTPTEIRQFLGLAGYYRRFIEGFSKIAKSMTKLTQKGIKFDWGEKEENAFQFNKPDVYVVRNLALPEGSEDFVVYCDASHKGLGDVLMQREKAVQKALGTDISMSTAYHPETDGSADGEPFKLLRTWLLSLAKRPPLMRHCLVENVDSPVCSEAKVLSIDKKSYVEGMRKPMEYELGIGFVKVSP